MFRRILAIGALAALSSGCSLVLVDGPPGFIPPDDPVPPGSCTIDRTIPLIDAVGAAAGLVTALTSSEGNAVRFGGAIGAALGFASYTGFRKVGSCRERMMPAPEGPSTAGERVLRFMVPGPTTPGAWSDGRLRIRGIEPPPLPGARATAPYWLLRDPGSTAAPGPPMPGRTGG